jgi:hypothetical protein
VPTVARRRGRDNFRGARGAQHQTVHGPLERVVRQHSVTPGEAVTAGYGVDQQTRHGTPVQQAATLREREEDLAIAIA